MCWWGKEKGKPDGQGIHKLEQSLGTCSLSMVRILSSFIVGGSETFEFCYNENVGN